MKLLFGDHYTLGEDSLSGLYAAMLLRDLGADVVAPALSHDQWAWQAASDWASSGLMWLTGWPHQPPLQGPAALPSCASGALLALQVLAGRNLPATLGGGRLLAERAALLGLQRGGQVSANGSCRLLQALDGWLAVNLARDDDWALLPAWLQGEVSEVGGWPEVTALVRSRRLSVLLERARIMGLPVAPAGQLAAEVPPWCRLYWQLGARPGAKRCWARWQRPPLVIDLSSLWAGPLCTHLLSLLGARVIKVESTRRPDGARASSQAFYDLLNAGKATVAFDLAVPEGRQQLAQLLLHADIVIEGSRPRALRQMGIDAQRILRDNPTLTWVGITGYGRSEPQADWVAFGDDAAVAAGATVATVTGPVFCGDALADPLTGMHAACAALACWRSGGGMILDLSLSEVAAHCLGFAPDLPSASLQQEGTDWHLADGSKRTLVALPRARITRARARAMGADTAAVGREFALSC